MAPVLVVSVGGVVPIRRFGLPVSWGFRKILRKWNIEGEDREGLFYDVDKYL